MSSSPECKSCGDYIHGGLVICEGCISKRLTHAREAGAREMRERCANVAREYKKPVRPKPTIEELEVILAQDTDPGIEITPDGEVRAAGTHLGHDIAAAISALPLTPTKENADG